LLAAHTDSATCRAAGTDLSVYGRYMNLFQIQISFACFHPVIINLTEWKTMTNRNIKFTKTSLENIKHTEQLQKYYVSGSAG